MFQPGPNWFYRWTRDLHLYFGLFISPFILLFSVSVFFLNHAKIDTNKATVTTSRRNRDGRCAEGHCCGRDRGATSGTDHCRSRSEDGRASPTGADSNPLVFWLRAMDGLRRDFCEAA